MTSPPKSLLLGAVAVVGAILLVVAIVFRDSPPPPPAPPSRPVNTARISDEGTLTRPSPEEDFLRSVVSAKPTPAAPVAPSERLKELTRVLAALRERFVAMKRLAEFYKKSDPVRYAAEMEALKPELTRLMQEARALLEGSAEAAAALFTAIKEESDPLLKERTMILLRYVDPREAAAFAAGLSDSTNSADRKAAIAALQDLRTADSAKALIRRAANDTDLDLRQRSIVGLGKLLAAPSPDAPAYQASVLEAIRGYTQPLNEPQIRSAAWDALAYPRSLSPDDQKLIRDALHTEKDRAVLKSVENAFRHMTARHAAQGEHSNPGSSVAPK